MPTPEQIDTGARQIADLMDAGNVDAVIDRLRSDAFQMKPQEFLKLITSVQRLEKKGEGADVDLRIEPDGSMNIGVTSLRVDAAIAKVKDNKVEAPIAVIPDRLRGKNVEQSDIPTLPKLSEAQETVLNSFVQALQENNPEKLKSLLVGFRDRNKDLEPIMENLAAQLSKHGIVLHFSHGGLKAGSDKDFHDVGHLALYDIEGGPVINVTGHPNSHPSIEGDFVSELDFGNEKNFGNARPVLKFVPRRSYFDKEDPGSTTQQAFESFAQKFR